MIDGSRRLLHSVSQYNNILQSTLGAVIFDQRSHGHERRTVPPRAQEGGDPAPDLPRGDRSLPRARLRADHGGRHHREGRRREGNLLQLLPPQGRRPRLPDRGAPGRVIEENVGALLADPRPAIEKLLEIYSMAASAYEEDARARALRPDRADAPRVRAERGSRRSAGTRLIQSWCDRARSAARSATGPRQRVEARARLHLPRHALRVGHCCAARHLPAPARAARAPRPW